MHARGSRCRRRRRQRRRRRKFFKFSIISNVVREQQSNWNSLLLCTRTDARCDDGRSTGRKIYIYCTFNLCNRTPTSRRVQTGCGRRRRRRSRRHTAPQLRFICCCDAADDGLHDDDDDNSENRVFLIRLGFDEIRCYFFVCAGIFVRLHTTETMVQTQQR